MVFYQLSRGFPCGTVVKNLSENSGDTGDAGSIPGWEDALEESMATHTSIPAWNISWTKEPGGRQSMSGTHIVWMLKLDKLVSEVSVLKGSNSYNWEEKEILKFLESSTFCFTLFKV